MGGNEQALIAGVLADLEGLARSGRAVGAPVEAIAVVERTRERIRYLQGTAADVPAGAERPPPQVACAEDLSAAFARLVEGAMQGDLPAWAGNLLATAHMRLSSELDAGGTGSDQRLAPRFREDQAARVERADGRELTVLVVDRSPLGLGLLAEEPLEPHELVRLAIDGTTADERHLAEVVFCLARGESAFHLGVELLASEPAAEP
ncbi:MAG TPA: hypothetical protein VKA55_01765 [Gammaproteobacteria bacterium]|nr:hypothetical protein [Gammaproteobacteria bacterium]